MTVFTLKIIACISMILDHIKYAIPATECFATVYLGRIAFPVFAFLITEGYIHTHSRVKYMLRMLIFALISQIPFSLFLNMIGEPTKLNVLFTFEIALIGLVIIDYFKNSEMNFIIKYSILLLLVLNILFIALYLNTDYSWFGVLIVLIFYIFKKSKILTTLLYSLSVILYFYIKNSQDYKMMFFYIIPLVLVLLYNGKQGKKLKYFFYVFYPGHLIILYLINYFLR